jgi:hypothetical protein
MKESKCKSSSSTAVAHLASEGLGHRADSRVDLAFNDNVGHILGFGVLDCGWVNTEGNLRHSSKQQVKEPLIHHASTEPTSLGW